MQKNFNNPLKYSLISKGNKTYAPNTNTNYDNTHEFEIFNKNLTSITNLTNQSLEYTFEDLKSGNQSLLPGERTVRLTDKLNPQKKFKYTRININRKFK